MEFLIQIIHGIIDHFEPKSDNVEPQAHSFFYFLCQAVFYIFCFRYRNFLSNKGLPLEGPNLLKKFRFDRIIASKFNPLKVRSLQTLPWFFQFGLTVNDHSKDLLQRNCWRICENHPRARTRLLLFHHRQQQAGSTRRTERAIRGNAKGAINLLCFRAL